MLLGATGVTSGLPIGLVIGCFFLVLAGALAFGFAVGAGTEILLRRISNEQTTEDHILQQRGENIIQQEEIVKSDPVISQQDKTNTANPKVTSNNHAAQQLVTQHNA